MFVESLALKQGLGNENSIAVALTNLGLVERDAGAPRARRGRSRRRSRSGSGPGDRQRMAVGLHNAALLDLDLRRYDDGAARASTGPTTSPASSATGPRWPTRWPTGPRRLERGDLDEAAADIAASLPRAVGQGARIIVPLGLEAAGGLAAARGEDEVAVRLWAAAAPSARRRGSRTCPPTSGTSTSRWTEVRERLDPAAFAAAWADGSRDAVDAAVAAAMGSPEPDRANLSARGVIAAGDPRCPWRTHRHREDNAHARSSARPSRRRRDPGHAPGAAGGRHRRRRRPRRRCPEIKLGCALVNPNPLSPTFPNRAIVCRWAPPENVAIRAYRVWRSVDAGPRRLLATRPSDEPHRYADFAIRSGHAYHYVVVGIGPGWVARGAEPRRSRSASGGPPRPSGSTA